MPGMKGVRLGGRSKGTPNKATAEIKAAAQQYGPEAIEKLVSLMRSEDAEVAFRAANAILDRGYGRPAQMLQGDPEKPLQHNVAAMDEFTRKIMAMGERAAA
jgi:hypothetical protein